ncbi:MAG: sugar ABC transporter ATP-binding protein [Propionibacteriaceae bacterium]|nr:sugar ABC transporter ATP-binding protein [Micropruina sp.]HBX80265.1 ABC transporter [Propionibacteriaceae bacterium]HBY23827.1 ABC transporter [Propionibacteriaceae bacterium]
MTDPVNDTDGSPSGGLIAEGLDKGFPGVQALKDVNIWFPYGKVTALMGENGAGKSTLLKILSGDYQPDAGVVRIDDEPVHFDGPMDSRKAGLRVVAQEPEIVPFVSVAENLFLGALPGTVIVKRDELHAAATKAIEEFGFSRMLSADMLGIDLSPAQRQLVEILRCLIDDPKILCFDEPTSSLSDSETDVLFALIARLCKEGKAIGYVSHRMREIFQIADRVTVLRDGKLIGTVQVAQSSTEEIVRMMVGRDLTHMHDRNRGEIGEPVLELKDVTTEDVRGISFTVHAGEIVALAGLVGAGRSELAMAVSGDVPLVSGTISVSGKDVRFGSPKDSIKSGIGLAPEERKADALVMVRSVKENLSLAVLDRLTQWGFIKQSAEVTLVGGYIETMRIRTPDMERPIENLSGGNQQKVVLARWLAKQTKVLILDEPTRGVDVGAKAEIYHIIDELAAAGIAILVISSELPEVLGLADRIVVMQNGEVTGELSHHEATEERVLALAMASELAIPEGRNS